MQNNLVFGWGGTGHPPPHISEIGPYVRPFWAISAHLGLFFGGDRGLSRALKKHRFCHFLRGWRSIFVAPTCPKLGFQLDLGTPPGVSWEGGGVRDVTPRSLLTPSGSH